MRVRLTCYWGFPRGERAMTGALRNAMREGAERGRAARAGGLLVMTSKPAATVNPICLHCESKGTVTSGVGKAKKASVAGRPRPRCSGQRRRDPIESPQAASSLHIGAHAKGVSPRICAADSKTTPISSWSSPLAVPFRGLWTRPRPKGIVASGSGGILNTMTGVIVLMPGSTPGRTRSRPPCCIVRRL